MPSHTDLLNCLRQVNDPELGKSLVELGMIRELKFENGEVSFTLALTDSWLPDAPEDGQ